MPKRDQRKKRGEREGIGAAIPLVPDLPNSKLAPTFWDRPTKKLSGDAVVGDVHRAVGEALSAWELTESVLSILYAVLVEAHSPAAARAYGAIGSSTGRLEALRRAGEVFFMRNKTDTKTYTSFNSLLVNYQRAASIRNDLAHGLAIDTKDKIAGLSGCFLVSAPYNSRRMTFDVGEFLAPNQMPDVDSVARWANDPARLVGFIRSSTYRYTSDQITIFTNKFALFLTLAFTFIAFLPAEFRKILSHSEYAKG